LFNVDSLGNIYFPAGVSVGNYPIINSTPTHILIPGPTGLISRVPISQLVSTSPVTSVFGRTGAVLAVPGDYDTDAIKENNNLYFTVNRARASISLTALGTTGPATYNPVTGVINVPQYQNEFSGVNTFNNRVGDVVLTALDVTTALTYTPIGVETDPVWAAQKVLYYTKVESDARFAAIVHTHTTSQVIEDTNLYYTDARARAAISLTTNGTSGVSTYINGVFNIPNYTTDLTGYATETYVNTQVSNLVDSAPTTLNTLNELAAALGDDANFSTTITTLIGTKEPAIAPGTTAQYWRGDKSWQTLPIYTLEGLGGVPTTRTLTINGVSFDLSANRSWTIDSMVYPAAGIAISTGTAWGPSITDNSTNWNSAFTDRFKWDGGSAGLNAATGRASLGLGTAATANTGDFAAASHTHIIANITGLQTALDGKEATIVAGTTAQYYRGDKTFQTLNTGVVPESGNLYFTNARAIASVLTGYSSGAGTISAADTILSAIQKLNGNIGALTTGVSSVNGLTGVVVLTTTNIAEGTNLYYTEARVSANTNVAANTAARHAAVTLGITNGLGLTGQQLSLSLASSSANGALSSTDWTTFNNKQNALSNPVTGIGNINYLAKFTSTGSTIGNSQIFDNGTNVGLFHDDPLYELHILKSGVNVELVTESKDTNRYATNNVLTNVSGASLASFGSTYPESGGSRWAGRSGLYINTGRPNQTLNVWIGTRTIINSLNDGKTAIGQSDPLAWLDVQGDLMVRTVANSTGDFLTISAGNVVSRRTAAQLFSDIGAASSSSLSNYLPLAGGVMTGNITFNAVSGRGLFWGMNTDGALIRFVSSGDSAGQSYLEIGTTDNSDEPIIFTQTGQTRVQIATDGLLKNGSSQNYVFENGATWAIAVTNGVVTTASYNNPSWITALAWSKITGAPSFLTSFTETDPFRVTAVTVSGTSTKTITLTRADNSTVSTTWSDIDTNTFVTSAAFSGGTLTLTRNDTNTVSVSLDGRYYLASNPSGYITAASIGNGTLTLNVSGNGLSGSTSFTANQSSAATFTVTSNATTSATANTLVYRDSGADIYARYFFGSYINTSDNDESGITRFVIKNGDNYHRSATTTVAANIIRGVASGTWSIAITGNAGSITNQANSATITASTGVNANHIVQRDANGYIYANYINFNTSESENPSISSFFTSNGDGWSRKSSIQHVRNQLGNYGGWITGYTETDTFASVVSRGSSTSGSITVGGNITVSSNNTTGGGIILADDGDIVDLNDGWASMRFSLGVRVYSANRGGSSVISLASNGTISASGDVIAFASSDKRLKDNLTKIEGSLEKVNKLNGYSFDWNDNQQSYSGHDYGVVAQEVEAIFPELVKTRDNGYKAVKYEKLIPVLIEAIKELTNKINKLEN